eukprot:GHRR01000500.1.p1 GENE.GHRR01000500.1~~GHRR01000500.1.p1  ORF type:complete len:620 (+),score=299.54 GHRR01000500.1:185-2044(+)
MSDTANEAPASEVAAPAAAPAAPVVDESYDESLLIKVKGKVKRPARPDDTERNLQVQKLQEQIDKSSARVKEIKNILDSRGTNKGASPEQQAIRERIQQLRGEFDTVLLQKKRLQSQSDDKKTQRDKLFAEQRSIKDNINGPTNLQTIDTQLQELEFKLNHESLTPAQEKAARERKERLERTVRPAVLHLQQVSARIDECKAASDAIRADISVLNAKLDKIKAARDTEEDELSAVRAAEQEARSDIPALVNEKKELWEVIQALRDKQREIRTAFNEKWEEFKKQDRAWKGWFAQERKKRQEQRHKEYLERQAARKANDDSHRPAKYEQEVYTCEQVLSYLKQFVSVEKSAATEKKELEAPAPGMKLLAKKESDENLLYSGMGGKKGKGARKAAEKQKQAETIKKLPQVLPLETLKTFMMLGLEAPKTNEEVPKTIEALEAKKKEFEEKRDKAAAEPEPEPEAEAAVDEYEDADAADGTTADETAKDADATEAKADVEAAAEADGVAAAEQNGKVDAVTAAVLAEGADAVDKAAEEPPAAVADAPATDGDIKAEANGNGHIEITDDSTTDGTSADADDKAEDTTAAGATEITDEASKAADGLGVKLRITDDGDVDLQLAV